MKWLRSLVIGLCAWAGNAHADEQPIDLNSFITANRVQLYFCTYKNNASGFKAQFKNAGFPFCAFNYASPQDWSGKDAILVDITNLESRTLKVFIRVDDDPSADGSVHCRSGWVTLRKEETITAVMTLRIDPMQYGMRTLPPIGNASWIADNRLPLNLRNIVSFRFFLEFPGANANIMIRNPRLASVNALTTSFVDEFGQFNRQDWPGKVHSVNEMIAKDADEARRLEQELIGGYNQADGLTRSAFGGWMDGPQLLPTGRFRTQYYNGKWWLVDPEGYLFISFGMNSIDYKDLPTVVSRREAMFTWLPPKTEYLGNHYYPITGVFAGPVREGDAYNFYSANLQRKYGQDFANINHIRTADRLLSWGFNTIGAFSNPEMWNLRRRIPYNPFVKVLGDHHRVNFAPGYLIHDPFDPAFRTSCYNSIAPIADVVRGDPYSLGWFVDNELTWTDGIGEEAGRYSVAYGTLKESITTSPAKAAWIPTLQTQYGDIQALNTSWGTNFTSWAELEGPVNLAQNGPAGRKADFKAWMTRYAKEYFRVVDEVLTELDPGTLYLGCRFYRYTKEIMDASAIYCDVLTFNVYGNVIPIKFYYPDIAYLNKPLMIGEFHFGATDRGMFNPGLAASFDQRDRANSYINYVKSVLENRGMVGCHWFQYVDAPLTGRMYDGENYNNGFVSVADIPYSELVQSAREINFWSYAYRYFRPN